MGSVLAVILFLGFGLLANLFTSDTEVQNVAYSGVLVWTFSMTFSPSCLLNFSVLIMKIKRLTCYLHRYPCMLCLSHVFFMVSGSTWGFDASLSQSIYVLDSSEMRKGIETWPWSLFLRSCLFCKFYSMYLRNLLNWAAQNWTYSWTLVNDISTHIFFLQSLHVSSFIVCLGQLMIF